MNDTGYRNTGDWNTGDWNTGNRNTGNRNTGYFNIDKPKVRIFWKETDIKREDIDFPSFCYFDLTEWINEKADLTDTESCKKILWKCVMWEKLIKQYNLIQNECQ